MESRTEEEQLALIKDWWQRNGMPLLTGGLLALVGVFGWQGWERYQTTQAQQASILYQQLLESALSPSGEADAAKVAELGNKLKEEFGASHYAQYGRLFVAKVAVESDQLEDAAAELRAIVEDPADEHLAELARQRLAQVLAAQNMADEALKLLEAEAPKAYLASREELKGDLLVRQGRPAEAREAYTKAKAALADDAAVGGLQMKLDDLAKGDA